MERGWAYLVIVVMMIAVASPMLRDPNDDGFPLSTYPMFSRHKDPRVAVTHVIGFSNQGRHRVIPPRVVATEEVMQALVTIQDAVKRGKAGELCRSVARSVAGVKRLSDIDRLEVRRDWFDAVAYFTRSRRPQRTVVHARCEVSREEAGQ